MFDNGLLKYYRTHPSKNGFLDLSKFGLIKKYYNLHGATTEKINGQTFYVKNVFFNDSGNVFRTIYDTEILLSQLYAKAGLQTTTYLPATSDDKSFLICDDVSSQSVLPASKYLYPIFGSYERGRKYIQHFPFLTSQKDSLNIDPVCVLTKQAMKEQTIMRILDVASYNNDRHFDNFFYHVSKRETPLQEPFNLPRYSFISSHNGPSPSFQTESQMLGTPLEEISKLNGPQDIMSYYRNFTADGVVSIDYGESGYMLDTLLGRGIPYTPIYINEFNINKLNEEDFKKEIQESETLDELIDKKELAEQIGSLNPCATAEDIYSTTGYAVDSVVIEKLTASYDDMAETLLH